MALNKGVTVMSTVRPIDDRNTYPTVYADEAYGGYHIASTIAERNSIPASRRKIGMECYVIETNKKYILVTNSTDEVSTNSNWQETPNSYGILSGGIVSTGDTDMTVKVSEVKGYFKSGEYFDIPAVASLAIEKPSAGNGRIDTIYIASDRTIKISKGAEGSASGTVFSNTFTLSSVPTTNISFVVGLELFMMVPGVNITLGTTTTEAATNIVSLLSSRYADYNINFSSTENVITISEVIPLGGVYSLSGDGITAGTATDSVLQGFSEPQTIPSDFEFKLANVTSNDRLTSIGGEYRNYNAPTVKYSDFPNYIENDNNSQFKYIENRLGTSVKDFGAVGDGITDDSSAFQLALDNTGTIYIPEGKYLLKSNVTLKRNTKIIGNQYKSIIIGNIYGVSGTAYNVEIDGITINNGMLSIEYTGPFMSTAKLRNITCNSSKINIAAASSVLENIIIHNGVITSMHGCAWMIAKNIFIINDLNGVDTCFWVQLTNFGEHTSSANIENVHILNSKYAAFRCSGGDFIFNNCSAINGKNYSFLISGKSIILNNCYGNSGIANNVNTNFADLVASNGIYLNGCYDLESRLTSTNGIPNTKSISISGNLTMHNCRFKYGIGVKSKSIIVGDYYDEALSLNIKYENSNRIIYGTAAPTTGTWAVGDKVYNTAYDTGKTIGWKCITDGTPGTWKEIGMYSVVSNSISNTPEYIGQFAKVGDKVYISYGTSAATDWVELGTATSSTLNVTEADINSIFS